MSLAGSVWRHKKKGGRYVIREEVQIRVTLLDGTREWLDAILYKAKEHNLTSDYVRVKTDFDSRFERLTDGD